MTTRATLAARIADDLARPDLGTQIDDAIDDAIAYFKDERFFFNETRSSTFVTEADKHTYTVDDDADIPLFVDVDKVWLTDSNSETYELSRCDWVEMDGRLDNSAATGRPYDWAYGEESFRLYPIPDGVYTVRPIGTIEVAPPASDDEADNVWMTRGFELIRCRAKWLLYGHVIKDYNHATAMGGVDGEGGAVGAALSALRRGTSKRIGSGRIVPTQF